MDRFNIQGNTAEEQINNIVSGITDMFNEDSIDTNDTARHTIGNQESAQKLTFKEYALALVEDIQLDIILGSVHFLSDNTNVAVPLKKPLTKEQVRNYYLQNLALVSRCNIDVLAHLGVYKRGYHYIPDESIFYPLIKDILATMIDRNIALEINYSSLRRGYPTFIPEIPILEMYLDLGGKLFSLGSDAHQIEHFDLYRELVPAKFCTSFRYL